MDTATILRSRPSASATDDRRVVTAGVAGVRSPPTRASGIEPPTRGRAARRLVASLARFMSRRIGTWRCMTSFRVLGCRPEYQHSRREEQEDEQDDAPTPHSDSDQSRVYGGLIRDPWRLDPARRTDHCVTRDRRVTESARDAFQRCFGHATRPGGLTCGDGGVVTTSTWRLPRSGRAVRGWFAITYTPR